MRGVLGYIIRQYLLIQPNKVVFLLRKKYEEEKGKFKIMHDIPLQRMS
mgnify:CR=1 FL=1